MEAFLGLSADDRREACREAEARMRLRAASITDPAETPEIRPYLAETSPDLFVQSRFAVRTLASRRTFWEKAMLLHEETYRPAEKKRAARLSRRYMFFGETPEFDEILRVVGEFEHRFNLSAAS